LQLRFFEQFLQNPAGSARDLCITRIEAGVPWLLRAMQGGGFDVT
jgi:hypothetical protein